MSCYTAISQANLIISHEHQSSIYKLWEELNFPACGPFEYQRGKPALYILDPCQDIKDYLKALGFEFSVEPNQDIKIRAYNGSIDDENLFFILAAPFISCGNFLVWECETKSYVWAFDGKDMLELGSLSEAQSHMSARGDKRALEEYLLPNSLVSPATPIKL